MRRALPAALFAGLAIGNMLPKVVDAYDWVTGLNDEIVRQACAVGTIDPGEGAQAGINDAIDHAGFDRGQVAGVMDAANYFSGSGVGMPAGTEVTVALDDYSGHQVITGVRLGEDPACDFRNNPSPNQIVYLPGK